MQRRQFLSLVTGAGVGSPLTALAQESPVRTAGEVEDIAHQFAEAQRARTAVLTMLHEMRAPLHVVLGYTELILDNSYGEAPDEMRVALHKIRQGGYSVAELINAAFELELWRRRRRGIAEQERK